MPESPLTVDQALQQAIAHHRAGQLQDAERLYRAILQAQPQHPDANHNLGVLAVGLKQPQAALPHLKTALEANPKIGQYWLSYADALIDCAQTDAARQIISAARQCGLTGEAVQQIEQRLPAEPSRAEQEVLVTLYQEGRFDELAAQAQELIFRFPKLPFAWQALAPALDHQNKYAAAIDTYRHALTLSPDSVMTLVNFAHCLSRQGRHAEALSYATRACEIAPDNVGAHINRGNALKELGEVEEATACYRQALTLNPEQVEAHNNLGAILIAENRFPTEAEACEAEACFHQALKIQPDYPDARGNLGRLLAQQGKSAEAKHCYQQAFELAPAMTEYAYLANLHIPRIPASGSVIAEWRECYENGIDQLMALPVEIDDPGRKLAPGSFELAYHNADDRPIMEALCRLFRAKTPMLNHIAQHITDWQPPTGRRIRLGICSNGFFNHSVGKLYQGLLRYLDHARFEVILLHAPKVKRDAVSRVFDGLADKSIRLPDFLIEQQQIVGQESLDVLFYPNAPEAPATYFLAYSRLAPIQLTSWGIADTTGIDTLDYFVSAKNIEPEDADAHYSERLIRLNRLPCYYQPFHAPTRIPSRTALGLPEVGTLYGCPQSLFKFHPDFDVVLADIAAGDPNGHIVMLDGHSANWNVLLHERWAKSAPILNERVIFLPRIPLDRFMALMAHFDVLLDPLHFGSGNTLYEAMVYGTPIVTWPGRFMRGRIVAGAYRQMGLADAPIAERIEDYAPLALAMGRDQARRQAFRKNCLAAAATNLFADLRAVREFETFLEAAVAAAGRGEKLPENWCVTAAGASA